MGYSTGKQLTATTIREQYKEPIGLHWRSHTLFILSTVAMGLFTDGFLYSLIIPIVPFMLEDGLGIPSSQVQKYTSAMMAAFAGSTVLSCPIAGMLADKISTRRKLYLFSLGCLLSATVMFFFGTTISVLIVARVLQGISSGFVWTIGLAMCIETVGAEHMGKSMGTIFSVIAIGSLWAPFLGGTLYRKAGLHGVLAIAIAVLSIDLVLRLLVIERKGLKWGGDMPYAFKAKKRNAKYRTDLQAINEEQPLLKNIEYQDNAFKLSANQPWISRAIPLLPCLKDVSLHTALLGSLIQAIVMGAFDSTTAVVAHELFEFDSFQAGLLFLPPGLMNLVCGPLVGLMIDYYGAKLTATSSFGILVPLLASLRFVHRGGLPQEMLYVTLLTLSSIGLAGSGTSSIVEAGAVIDRYHRANPGFFGENGPYAMVYGMNGMVFNAGLTIGPELAAALKESIGYGNMNLVLAGLSGLMACLCFYHLGGRPRRRAAEG